MSGGGSTAAGTFHHNTKPRYQTINASVTQSTTMDRNRKSVGYNTNFNDTANLELPISFSRGHGG